MLPYNKTRLVIALSGILLLPACSLESQSWVNESRLEVKNDQFTDTVETSKMDSGMLHAVGDYYRRFGNGPMNLVVTYDPQSRLNTKQSAQIALARLNEGLAKNGVSQVKGTLNPMKGSGDVSQTLISFPAVTASAPTGCKMMPGYDSPATNIPGSANIDPDYKYGCTVETLLSRQVARPADLLGRQGFETNSDGRRQERVLSTRGYYGDQPNGDLNGEKASGK